MNVPSLSFAELEALHDVLEAAKCFWHKNPMAHARAKEALKLVNSLCWRLGEELPNTGTPSKKFEPVMHSASEQRVEEIVEVVVNLTRDYANANDPWWADTVLAPPELADALSKEELIQFKGSLERLGLVVVFDGAVPSNQLVAERRDLGPWPELVTKP